jgi:hypothetical protein
VCNEDSGSRGIYSQNVTRQDRTKLSFQKGERQDDRW